MTPPGFLDNNEISKCPHLREHRDVSEDFSVFKALSNLRLSWARKLGKPASSGLWQPLTQKGTERTHVPSFRTFLQLIHPSAIQALTLSLTVSCQDLPQTWPSLNGKGYAYDSSAHKYSQYLGESRVVFGFCVFIRQICEILIGPALSPDFQFQLLRPNVSLGSVICKDMNFGTTQICVQIPIPPLTSHVTLGRLPNIS